MRWRSVCGLTVLALCVLGLVSACASNTLTVLQPKTQAIPPGTTVALRVDVDVPEPLPVHQEVATRLRERLFVRLISDGIFRAVVLAPEPADYRMEVKIRGARQVSAGARIMLGSMIGPNTAAVAVVIRHQATEHIVTAFEATATSESHPFSSESSLDDAVRRVVDRIIEGLR